MYRTPMYEKELSEEDASYAEDMAEDMIEAVGREAAITVCLYVLETLMDFENSGGVSLDLNNGVQMHVIRLIQGAIHDS